MGDLIDRDWVLKRMVFEPDYEVVRMAPKVEAEPVRHGRWIFHQAIPATCSVCGFSCGMYDDDYADRYCSHCGAKMEGSGTNA